MSTASQTTIHPTVKNMLGKRPTKMSFECSNVSTLVEQAEEVSTNHADLPIGETIKVPRYIPPKLPERIVATPVRGELHCMKKKLIIGNISRWIPVSERDDTASHKWMVSYLLYLLLYKPFSNTLVMPENFFTIAYFLSAILRII